MRTVRRGAIAAVLAGASIVAAACSNGSSSYASLCPSTDLPACPTAPDAADCSRSNFACGLDCASDRYVVLSLPPSVRR